MGSFMDYAFPAGEERDASDDEWDIDCCQEDKKSSHVKYVDAVVPEDNVSVLKKAISDGDTQTVEQLLDKGMDVETRLGFDWTPLMCAVSVANYDLAKLLLDRGARANFSKDNWTVLMASCTAPASEDKVAGCVELLLSRNADVNMTDRSQMTCLMLAAREGHSKVINLLLSRGANINAQDTSGYTALSIAVQYGREEAVLKLLQLGADKTIRTKSGQSPVDLAQTLKHTQITRILTSSPHISSVQPCSSVGETLDGASLLKTTSEHPSSMESATKLDDLELLLHGLDLGYLADIMTENDITWSYLLTMEKEDLEKVEDDCNICVSVSYDASEATQKVTRIGITNPEHQQKLLSAVQQMHLDKVDLDTIRQLGADASGSEDLHNFLISVRQQCCYLTETIHDVINRFPRHTSQLVFSLDPNKEAQTVCNELVIQTKDLQKEVTCLHDLIGQLNEAEDCCRPPRPGSRGNRRMRYLTRVVLSTVGATVLMMLYKAACWKVYLPVYRRVF